MINYTISKKLKVHLIKEAYKITRAMNLHWIIKFLVWITILEHHLCKSCTFYSSSDEYASTDTESGNIYIPLKEDRPVNDVVLTMNVFPRKSIELRAIDRSSGDDHKYFRIHELNGTTIQIILSQTLDDLVDNDNPQNVLKFKIQCNSAIHGNRRNHDVSFLMVTVYVEDVNDNKPVFMNTPYELTIDETTPLGSSVFMGIKAVDRDKPNTPNSDIQYFIGHQTSDTKGGFFMLDSPHRPHVILKRSLDYDHGIRQFDLSIIARDRGVPPQQTNTTLSIFIDDVDDLPPVFTQEAYYTKVKEFFTITGKSIHKPLKIDPPIEAYDQDSLNSTLMYSIVSGNDREVFWIHPTTGVLYLKKEIDLEAESLQENSFYLQIDVKQKNDPLKRAMARVEIEIIDINDNQPEFEVDLYNISIVENLPNGFSVLQVNALDRDQGENAMFFYKIFKEEPKGAFAIDSITGWMTVKNQSLLDREERPTVKLIVEAIEKVKPYNRRESTSESTVAVDITLLDSNDNSPIFEMGNLYEFKVDVNASVGFVVGKIKAYDPDDGPNGKITYEMKNRKETAVPFQLDSKTGVLKVTGKLVTGRIALFVEACDQPINPSETRCTLAVLTLDIVEAVDVSEIKFMGAPYEFWIGSNAPIGTSVGQVRVVYRDDIIFDLLHSYSEGVPFAIEEQSGIITVIRPINSFNRNAYHFEAVATFVHSPVEHVKNQSRSLKKALPEELGFQVDEGIVSDLNFASMYIANVTINVVNPSSTSKNGVFVKSSQNEFIEFKIMENLPNAIIGNLLSKNFTDMNKNLQASPSTQSTTVQKRPIMRENRQMLNMSSSKFRKHSVEPRFKNITATVTTPSTIGMITRKPRTNIFNSTARRQAITNGRVVKQLPPITLKSTNNTTSEEKPLTGLNKYLRSRNRIARATKNLNFFIVNDYDLKNKMYISNDGKLMTINGLDREEKDSYKLSVIAEYTNGLIESAGIYQINVIVEDENDNSPKFERSNYVGIISENSALGTEVLLNNLIIVNDADAGKNAEFQLSILGDGNRLFTIEKSNDVSERTSPLNNFNNSALALFSDTVLDEYSSMVDINLHLMMLSSREIPANQSHYVIKFSGPSLLDRERKNFYKLRLLAKDSGGLQEEAQLMIFVTDVNDNPPSFEKLAVFKQTGIELLQYSDKMEIYFIDNALPSEPQASPLEAPTQRSETSSTSLPNIKLPPPASNKIRIRPKHPIGSPRALSDNYDDEIMITEDRSFKSNSPEVVNKNSFSKYPQFMIEESLEAGVTILQLTASDDDYGPNAQITYEISSEQIIAMPSYKGNLNHIKKHSFFFIDRMSGELKVNRQLIPNLEILVNVTAKDSGGLKDTIQIGIQISDVNNHEPVFLRPFYSFDIEEGFHVSKILGSVQAVDDDFDDNANITYSIVNVDESKFPFSIIPKTGLLKVSGQLDREQRSLYEFRVMAKDNSRKYKQLNSTVIIEINVIDLNDNAPVFINYDDVMINEISTRGRKLNSDIHDAITPQNFTPVYKISLDRNVSPRRLIKEVKATDVDYALNGMVFYNFLHNNVSHLFEIDAREGFITTTPHQEQLRDLNNYELLNLTVVASDLGNPVKSSYAIVLISLTGEKRFVPTSTSTPKLSNPKKNVATKPILFVNQYYEIDVLENSPTPMRLIQFNTTNENDVYVWSLVLENKNYSIPVISDIFGIDNGILWLQRPLDREEYSSYTLKIRADLTGPRRPRNGKSMQVMYPVTDDRIENLDDNEVRVVIRVVDVNDHVPMFRDQSPIIAVIPDTVTYGYNVLKVTADDRDIGLNGDVRYSLINEPTNFFGIDALTGQVRTLGPLWRSHQKVFGFDVRATDRQGSENGKTSIINVLVYVLEEHKHVKFIMSGTTMDIEKQAEAISRSLSEATNLIVKIRMLEPHETSREFWTNVYIYAIDPKTNTVVDMEELQEIMEQVNMQEIQPSIPVVELTKLGVPAHLAPKIKQGSGELASIVLSITILIGGVSTAICILCVRYKRRIQNAIAPVRISPRVPSRAPSQIIRQHLFLPQPSGDSSTDPVSDDTGVTDIYQPVLKQLIPTRKNNHINGNQHLNQADKREYIDIPLPKSLHINHHQNHDAKCARYNEYIMPTKNNIIKHYQTNGCACSSDDKHDASSNNSYEDSLKEFATTETETTMTSTTRIMAHHQRTRIYDNNFDRQSNRHSFSGHSFQMEGRNNKRNRSFMYPNNIR